MKSYSIYADVIAHAQNDKAYAESLCKTILDEHKQFDSAKDEESTSTENGEAILTRFGYGENRTDCITPEIIRSAAERLMEIKVPFGYRWHSAAILPEKIGLHERLVGLFCRATQRFKNLVLASGAYRDERPLL